MQVKVIVLVVVSVVIAVLLATALTSFTRVPDSALAENVTSPQPSPKGKGDRPATAGKNYLPIIFLNSATAGGAWLLAGNSGTNWATDFLGTTDNMTLTFRVSNTVAYRIVPAADPGLWGFAPNLIGGAQTNQVSPGLRGATIAGGGVTAFPNVISDTGNYAFIGGGLANTANSNYATVGGGAGNKASNYASAIGGGSNNSAGGYAATVSAGFGNLASGDYSAVGGGTPNTASGAYATVPGGFSNRASGDQSFAAGTRALAQNQGAFVWADSTNAPFASTGTDQFLVRAGGGVGINTNVPSRTLEVNGKIGVYDNNTRTYYGGIATEVNSQMIDFGINDDDINRFGGAYSSTVQGGFVRVDTRTGFDLFQFQGRQAGNTTLSQLASLNSAGKFTASGGFNGQCLSSGFYMTSGGNGCNMDVAEGFATAEWTAPGDVVALVTHAGGGPTVRKATGAEGEVLVGVVSQNPGLVFDNGTTHLAGDNSNLITADKTVVALVGRVNVKVSVENGAVHIGDALTSSSTPGVAMRATQASRIIGYAMEQANAEGMVLALVQPGDHVPAAQWEALKQNAELQARVSALEASQSQNALSLNALAPWGVVSLVAVWMMRRGRGTLRRELRSSE